MRKPSRFGVPKSHPDYWKRLRLERRYGVTRAEFDARVEAQGSRCAICGTSDHGSKEWHLDHNHSTGAPRGLLCFQCNVGLGRFGDSVERLQSAVEYLQKWHQNTPVRIPVESPSLPTPETTAT